MRMKKGTLFFIVLFVLSSVAISSGQEILEKMKVIDLKPSSVIPLDTSKVVLVVKAAIKDLGFKTNHGEIISRKVSEGEWRLQLEPGTHLITFSANDFQSITEKIYIAKHDKSKEIKIEVDIQVNEEPPRIVHLPLEQATDGDTVNWVAIVTGNINIANVKLYYRLKGENEYKAENMGKMESNNYQKKMVAKLGGIEYYLEAQEVSGKEPILWKNAADPQLLIIKPRPKGSKKWLWIGLGTATLSGGALILLKSKGSESKPLPEAPEFP